MTGWWRDGVFSWKLKWIITTWQHMWKLINYWYPTVMSVEKLLEKCLNWFFVVDALCSKWDKRRNPDMLTLFGIFHKKFYRTIHFMCAYIVEHKQHSIISSSFTLPHEKYINCLIVNLELPLQNMYFMCVLSSFSHVTHIKHAYTKERKRDCTCLK